MSVCGYSCKGLFDAVGPDAQEDEWRYDNADYRELMPLKRFILYCPSFGDDVGMSCTPPRVRCPCR